jgi:hypothetical protein
MASSASTTASLGREKSCGGCSKAAFDTSTGPAVKTDSLFYGNRLYTALYEKINPVSSEAKSFLTLEDLPKGVR